MGRRWLFEDDNTAYLPWSGDTEDPPWPPGFKVGSLFEKYQVGLGDGLYFDVLLPHRGWKMIQGEGQRYQYPSVWRKSNSDHRFDLLMTLYSGFGENTKWGYTIIRQQNNQELLLESEEWADWDHRGRL